jgi:hypothetical protein
MKAETYLDITVQPGKWYVSRIHQACCSAVIENEEVMRKSILAGPFDSDMEAEAAQTAMDDPGNTAVWEG